MKCSIYKIGEDDICVKVKTGSYKGFYVNQVMKDIMNAHCDMFLSCELFKGPWNNRKNESFPFPFLEFVGYEDGLTFTIVFSKTDKPGYLKLLTVCEFNHVFEQMHVVGQLLGTNITNFDIFTEEHDYEFIREADEKNDRQGNDPKWVQFFGDVFLALTNKDKFYLEPIIDYFDS